MSFSLMGWIREKVGATGARAPDDEIKVIQEHLAEVNVRELAFWTCGNLIASALSKCEFKTYQNGKEIKGAEYYLWNIEPNKNQCSSEFLRKLVTELYRRNEVLVIEHQGQLFVADGYLHKEYALYDDIFTQVQVGDFSFNKSFLQSEVIFIKLNSVNMRNLVGTLYDSYQKLIAYSMSSYQRSRGNRGKLKIETMASGEKNFHERFNKLMTEDFKKFFSADNAVLPLFEGYDYTELGSKTYSSEGTRDIRAMINDVFDFTAEAFQIPPALVTGSVEGAENAVERFLTFCLDPLTDILAEEINRKRYRFTEFQKGNYIKIDTKAVKHVDLLSVATAIDKLISSGSFCVNDIRKLVGEAPIDEPWAYQHFMTKNYETVADLMRLIEGGE